METWQAVEMLLAELHGRGRAYAPLVSGAVISHRIDTPASDRRKAVRLAYLATEGAEALVRCDTHHKANRPDLWEQCRKVNVVDALLGRRTDCGA